MFTLSNFFFQQAPAVDVVAIGLADGQIVLHNLKFDETIVKFTQDWGVVTTIAFRTGMFCFLALLFLEKTQGIAIALALLLLFWCKNYDSLVVVVIVQKL